MSPGAQRIAIADACGKDSPSVSSPLWGGHGPNPDYIDYLGDLNAMHSAVFTLDERSACNYVAKLAEIVGFDENSDTPWWEIGKLSEATPAQRAEAFLRTLSLWDDSK